MIIILKLNAYKKNVNMFQTVKNIDRYFDDDLLLCHSVAMFT